MSTRKITLSVPMIEAVLNADERGGMIQAPHGVLRALARRGLASHGSRPSRLTEDGRAVARMAAGSARRTFTLGSEES